MKNTLMILSAVALLAVTGCSALDNAVLEKQQTVTPPVTNSVTGVITPPATNTVYAPKPAIQNTIAAAEGAASLVPPPYGTIAGSVLALLAAGLGLYARSRNNQLIDTTSKLSTANSVVSAVVAGVEAVGHPETKAAIQNAAVAAGVQTVLDPIVQTTGQAMK